MYCIVSYCVLCMYLICYLYTIVLTKVTRNKDIYMQVRWPLFCRRIRLLSLLREGGSRCLEGNIRIVTSSVFVKLICLVFLFTWQFSSNEDILKYIYKQNNNSLTNNSVIYDTLLRITRISQNRYRPLVKLHDNSCIL